MKRTLAPLPPTETDTLVHRLHQHALEQPEQIAYTFLRHGYGENHKSISYRELDQRARIISAYLQEQGAKGRPVLLLFPSGLEYIVAYCGCLYAGAIAVPAYVPHSARDLPRIQAIIADAQATVILTTTESLTKMTRWIRQTPDLAHLTWIPTDGLEERELDTWQATDITGSTVAFLQYTSGSTTTPRGVMVSHNNLMHNLAVIQDCWKIDEMVNPVGVYWLPIFHDMGLILGLLSPLYSGYPTYFMSPVDFLQRPLRWLQALSDYRGTYSSAPNFAYELCLRRISREELSMLDLSHWAGAGNGAEPVRSETLERFISYFSACGFSPTAFRPAYGLAESTLVVTSGHIGETTSIKTISEQRLEEGYSEAISEPGQRVKQIVGCGGPGRGQRVEIVDPETFQRCEDARIGEIWTAGPSVALGYWQRPEQTVETFQAYLANGEGPFLRTGDLGVFQDGNLFVTGRVKDMLIINGRNLYPQDIELTAEQAHPGIRAGNSVAFSLELEGAERLVILVEVHRHSRSEADVLEKAEPLSQANMQEIINNVRQAVADRYGIHTYKILALKPGGVLKTSSGKLRRLACREAFLQGTLKTWEIS